MFSQTLQTSDSCLRQSKFYCRQVNFRKPPLPAPQSICDAGQESSFNFCQSGRSQEQAGPSQPKCLSNLQLSGCTSRLQMPYAPPGSLLHSTLFSTPGATQPLPELSARLWNKSERIKGSLGKYLRENNFRLAYGLVHFDLLPQYQKLGIASVYGSQPLSDVVLLRLPSFLIPVPVSLSQKTILSVLSNSCPKYQQYYLELKFGMYLTLRTCLSEPLPIICGQASLKATYHSDVQLWLPGGPPLGLLP